MWYGGYTLSISLRSRFFCAFFHRKKSPMVGGGAIDAPSERLPTCGMDKTPSQTPKVSSLVPRSSSLAESLFLLLRNKNKGKRRRVAC